MGPVLPPLRRRVPASGAIRRCMAQETLTGALLRVVLVLALLLLAWWLVDVVLLTFAGVLIAVLLRAPADWLSARSGLSPNLSIAIVLVVLTVGLGGAVWGIAPEVGRQFDELIAQLPGAVRELSAALEQHGWGRWLVARGQSTGEMLARPEAMQGAGRALSTTFGALTSLFVVAVVGLWVTLQPGVYINNGVRLFPVPMRPRMLALAGECGHALQRWLLGCLVSMLIVSTATFVGLWLLGVPLALLLALFAGSMVFIPNFGPLLSAIPALLLALMQGPMAVLWVAVLYVGVQIVDNTITTPLIQRQAVSLPPALMMFAQTAMGVLAGGLGVIVAVPVMALALIVVRRLHVDPLEDPDAPFAARPGG
jgi:predicted PurR-regulated permease PerM